MDRDAGSAACDRSCGGHQHPSTMAERTNRKTTKKAASKRTTSPAKKTAGRRTTAKKAAPRKAGKGAPKQAAAKKAASAKKTASKRAASPVKKTATKRAASPVKKTATKRSTRRSVPTAKEVQVERPVQDSTANWPNALEAAHDQPQTLPAQHLDPRAALHTVQGSPNEHHPGSTRRAGATRDRPGSQPERKRHQYPGSNNPNRGSARSAEAKGRRRDNMHQGG